MNSFIYNFALPALVVSSELKNKANRIIREGIGVSLTLALGAGAYAAVCDEREPNIEVRNAAVASIEPYCCFLAYEGPTKGYHVWISGRNQVISFPSTKWDESVRVGDSVDLVVREYFLGGIEGISIDDHK